MKVISILLALINSLTGALLILSCISAGEALGWIAFKTGAGLLAIYFGILTFKDSVQPIHLSRTILSGLILVIAGVSAAVSYTHLTLPTSDLV